MLFQIMEFRDVNDTASLNGVADKDVVSMEAQYFDWNQEFLKLDQDGSLVLQVQASNYNDNTISRTGNISITVSNLIVFVT